MSISTLAVTLFSAASMNVPFVATIKLSISSRTRLGRHILRLIKDFFFSPNRWVSMLRFTVRSKLSPEIIWKRWCINRCRYKRVQMYILNSGHSVGWRAEAPIIVAGKKVSGCNRASNSLRTILYHGKCGEKHCWHFCVLAFDKTLSAWREFSVILKYALPIKPVCLSL
jgi:hypothetical protein